MSHHNCGRPNCDGTRLGHELARDFPDETGRISDVFDQITQPANVAHPRVSKKCGRWEPDHQPHGWSTPWSRYEGIAYWCEGPTIVEGGRRGLAD